MKRLNKTEPLIFLLLRVLSLSIQKAAFSMFYFFSISIEKINSENQMVPLRQQDSKVQFFSSGIFIESASDS